jgi:hypothetical protein
MKTKLLAAAILTLTVVISGCCSGGTEQAPNSRVHGDAGVGAQSQNTSHISPDRPAN